MPPADRNVKCGVSLQFEFDLLAVLFAVKGLILCLRENAEKDKRLHRKPLITAAWATALRADFISRRERESEVKMRIKGNPPFEKIK